MAARLTPDHVSSTFSKNADLVDRREQVFGAYAPLFYDDPVHLVRGEGVFVYDSAGNRYLDMYNNVPCVGHGNPRVVEAMSVQAATFNAHSRYLHEGVITYAERLLAKHDASLDRVLFTCTGSEANEAAIGIARVATGGTGVICSGSTYHGNTELVSKLTRAQERSDPQIRSVRFPETYRPISPGLSDTELCDLYLDDVREAIDSFAHAGVSLAAMLVCPIFANEGLPNVPGEYLVRAAQLVRDAGGLFIADEVQAGFGRAGRWWGYEVSGSVPDIATMGKPMGNGFPLAGVVANAELMDGFRSATRYFNTFSASPLQAAVGSAVLDVIEQDDLDSHAAEVGAYLRQELHGVDCEAIGDIRGVGLFTGIDWVADGSTKMPDVAGAKQVVNRLREKGVLVGAAGALSNIVKLRPPLVIERDHIDIFLAAFSETVEELYR